MSEPDLIVLIGLELISEAESKISVYSFTKTVVIVKESVVIILILLHFLVGLALNIVFLPGNIILEICNVPATFEPSSSICLIFLL
jgi:hypothetical protein